jgi:hypothetical protein
MGSSPKAPDPMATAGQQAQMNADAAVKQNLINATNQVTPYGNLTYTQGAPYSDGTPHLTATQTLSPEQQNLYNLSTQTQGQLGQIGVDQTRKIAGILNTPFDLNTAANTQQSNIATSLLDPIWKQKGQAFESDLLNRGITPGSEAYTNMHRDFGDEQSRAYNNALLSGRQQAVSEALTNRNQPLNEISALLSNSQVQQPNFVNAPQSQVAPVDYMGAVNNQYNQQMGRQNALYGAIGSMAGTALGGWGMGGFKKPSFFGGGG